LCDTLGRVSETPRAIFFGTPEFAVPCLAALCEVAHVTLVVSQPDRPAGRGLRLSAPPVKEAALARGIEVLQATKVRVPAFAERLCAERADVALVVAFGRILPRAVLDAPRLGCLNVHASLLPELRGAAPIQWAVIRGLSRTGVCLMRMDAGLDTGPVLARRVLDIGPDETAGELATRLAPLGAELVREALPRYLAGALLAEAQDEARASLAPILRKDDGRIDWTRRAREVHDLVRGTQPWPGAWTVVGEARVKLHRTRVVAAEGSIAPPGTIVATARDELEIACGSGVLGVVELQREGARRMPAGQFVAGQRVCVGARVG
jgi:methionyl-tRNA formyltransferase